jgi:DNA-binding IclR family transcriptional regulator
MIAKALSGDNEAPQTQSIQGVQRALEVLELFIGAESPTLGVTEIASSLGLSKAVVHRILSAFRIKGFVDMDPTTHRYLLGPQALVLGLTCLDRIDMRNIARAAMIDLVHATDETATLSVRVGWNRVYLDQVTPDRELKMVVQIGRPFPLHTGASSKALLAYMPNEKIEEYLTSHELVALTDRSLTDPEKIRAELALIRKQGYAYSLGERDGSAASVAAPLHGHDEQVVGVISVSGPAERFRAESEKSALLLLEAVHQVSQRLGSRRSMEERPRVSNGRRRR